ncbi:hypothetical protein [Pedobacter endophyticus]|uniref:hypothetical protein n=1 Tax=Pedobacter endophyticus TaxID=2789740 RepID=UPI001E38FEE2|nr:hypothetical protein [Pedobacter endophyticus]
MKIADKKYFEQYQALFSKDLKSLVEQLGFTEQNSDLGYQTQASAVKMKGFFGEITQLLASSLSTEGTFYFAC